MNHTTIYQRLVIIANHYELNGINQLAKELGYNSAEKLYRLDRVKNSSPGFDVVLDLANTFESLNIRWLVTGEGRIDFNETSLQFVKPKTKFSSFKSIMEEVKTLKIQIKEHDDKIRKLEQYKFK